MASQASFVISYLYGLPGMASQACVGLSLGFPRVGEVAAESEYVIIV